MAFQTYLTHFIPLVSFDTLRKHQKNERFSDVFGEGGVSKETSGMKWVNLMGLKWVYFSDK